MKDKKFNPHKTASLEELKELLKQAKSVAVVDYTGMTVAAATELRKAVKASGGLMKVTKNTLFKIAASERYTLDADSLQGLSAFIFSLTDEIASLKAVASKLPFKLGLAGDRVLSIAEITRLATTPSKETSVAKLMFLLQYHTSKFVRTIDALAKKGVN